QVTVSGASQDLPGPTMPSLPMFEVYSQGRSSNLSIVNGQVSSSVIYRYMLLPQKPGTFPIDNVAVVHNNKRYKGERLELTVLDQGTATPKKLEDQAVDLSGRTKDYFMEAVVDKKNPYVGEQVTLTLKFFTAVQYYGSPELSEPTTTGFWTEVLGNKAPYYQKINNRTYKVIERKYALFPTQTGELTISRAGIKFTVPVRDRRFRDPFDMFDDFFGRGQEVSVHSKPISINVRPLPHQGRPADFTGTIGRFKISAIPNKREVEVNQPVTVTIKITGTGNIKSVAEPVIPQLEDFRIYRASSSEKVTKLNDRLGGAKVFEEVFIPRRPGRLEIPSLGFNYFDPEQGRYHSVSTQPISVNVIRPEGYTASPDIPFAAPDLSIGSKARDIRYIKDNIGSLRPAGQVLLFTPLYLVINGVPVLALITMVLVRRRREKLAADIGYARSRRAGKMARRRLSKARSLTRVEQAGEFYAEIYTALTSYVADTFNISPHGLTTDRISELLQSRGADDTLVEEITDLLNRCDFARFAPASVRQTDIDNTLRSAESAMVRMEGMKRG
ncbi:MAG: BatD family protein, partial [Candidatus Zixiibacteriota bacterium]